MARATQGPWPPTFSATSGFERSCEYSNVHTSTGAGAQTATRGTWRSSSESMPDAYPDVTSLTRRASSSITQGPVRSARLRTRMDVLIVDHPLAARLLTRLRDETTDRATFRLAMDELAGMLVYEACRTLPTVPVDIRTPMAPATGVRIASPPLVVPVLRAGLGLHGAVIRLLPETETAFIGVSRNEETLQPEPYMNSVPADLAGRPVLVLDPMLATGGSLEHACRQLRHRAAGPMTGVCVLAAPEGLRRVEQSGLVERVVTAAVDDHLDERAFIVPGLGDAGDRLFGTA
jgi:uracil phosphoribosyltransferase